MSDDNLADAMKAVAQAKKALAELAVLSESVLSENATLKAALSSSEARRVEAEEREEAERVRRVALENGTEFALEQQARKNVTAHAHDLAERLTTLTMALEELIEDGDVDPVQRLWAQELLNAAMRREDA